MDVAASTCDSPWPVNPSPNACLFACEAGYTASGTAMTCVAEDVYTADKGPVPPTCTGVCSPVAGKKRTFLFWKLYFRVEAFPKVSLTTTALCIGLPEV